jgi:hypothetical protein
MCIATSLVAVAALAGAPVNAAPPPIVVNLSVAPNVSSSLLARIVKEADEIFRDAGVTFIWRHGETLLPTLRVAIGNDRGVARSHSWPIGWIRFDDDRPDQEIYLSYANAQEFFVASREVVGVIGNMTPAERDMHLGRLMGRALAHELAHYLLASKAHTPMGLLKGARTAQEFFAFDRSRFQLDVKQRTQIAARLQRQPVIASR